jgi:segregation and condensation protein B
MSELSDLDDVTGDELELAYLRALDALDAMDSSVQAVEAVAEQMAAEMPAGAPTKVGEPASVGAVTTTKAKADGPPVTPRQVIEACLFVGGSGLTARKLASILKGDYTAEFVEETIDDLNHQYSVERRPYEIGLGEGGYALSLKDDYERLRFKAFGLGPKEVRLTQDALEILAVVAYQQPITETDLSEVGKPNASGVLRQLLRRDLIAVHRDPAAPKVVRYVTTERFLSLFGIGELDELPRPEAIGYK